jgi:hypothetical protein
MGLARLRWPQHRELRRIDWPRHPQYQQARLYPSHMCDGYSGREDMRLRTPSDADWNRHKQLTTHNANSGLRLLT